MVKIPLPTEEVPDTELFLFLPSQDVQQVYLGSEPLEFQDRLTLSKDCLFLRLPAGWGGKTLYIKVDYWRDDGLFGVIGSRDKLVAYARALQEYWRTAVVLGHWEYKRGTRSEPGSWDRVKNLDFRAERGQTLTYRAVLPNWDLALAMSLFSTESCRFLNIYLDGREIYRFPSPDSMGDFSFDGAHFLTLPPGWQGKTVEIEVASRTWGSQAGMLLFDGARDLGTLIADNRVSFRENVVGWVGGGLGLFLLTLFLWRRWDSSLLAFGGFFLFLAWEYGPWVLRASLGNLWAEGSWFLSMMESTVFSLLVWGMYITQIPDHRQRTIRITNYLLISWTAFFGILGCAIILVPGSWMPWDIGIPQFYLQFVVGLWGFLLFVTNRKKPKGSWILGALYGELILCLSYYLFRDFAPVSIPSHWDTTIMDGIFLVCFLLIGSMPVGQFFRNEADLREKNQVLAETNLVFKKFVPQEFLDVLGVGEVHDIQLGRQSEQELTVLFSDIRSFTRLAERLDPSATFRFINDYLQLMAPVIRREGGYIDKYLGDGIMAVFPGTPASAFRAALGLLEALEAFNHDRSRQGNEPIRIGIGLHHGKAMLGTIGHQERMDSTVLSDTVNTSARLESLTKHYGVAVLLSDQVAQSLEPGEIGSLLFVDRVVVYGKDEPLTLWTPLEAFPVDERDWRPSWSIRYRRIWDLVHEGALEEAGTRFMEIQTEFPSDKVIEVLRRRWESRRSGFSQIDAAGLEILDFK